MILKNRESITQFIHVTWKMLVKMRFGSQVFLKDHFLKSILSTRWENIKNNIRITGRKDFR